MCMRIAQQYYALVANQTFFFNDVQNESIAEQLRERVRFFKVNQRLEHTCMQLASRNGTSLVLKGLALLGLCLLVLCLLVRASCAVMAGHGCWY